MESDVKDVRNCVQFAAFDQEGNTILNMVIPTYEWYENLHPVIDTDLERKRLKIRKIDGRQFNPSGEMVVSWSNEYATDGSLLKSTDWQPDGSVNVQMYLPDGSIHRTSTPPSSR